MFPRTGFEVSHGDLSPAGLQVRGIHSPVPSSWDICSGSKGRTGSFLREFLGFWLLPKSIRIISLDESNGF